jgi:hypothetical protein
MYLRKITPGVRDFAFAIAALLLPQKEAAVGNPEYRSCERGVTPTLNHRLATSYEG